MNKDKTKVVERLRAKILPENRMFIRKNLEISEQVSVLLKEKGWTQKELAYRLGKTESEVSKMLSGLHNLTLMSIAKLEAELGSDIIITPIEACRKYKKTEYIPLRIYVPIHEPVEESTGDYIEESNVEYDTIYQKIAQ